MTVRIEQGGTGQMTFDVSEVFDTGDASTLREALGSCGPNVSATIDFHRARRCEPLAVAVLSKELVARRGWVVVLGLGLHERRLLRYLGLSEGDFAPTHLAYQQPEPSVADAQIEDISPRGGSP